jgi:hypothetical protein
MRKSQTSQIIPLLKRAIEATFNSENWKEIGYMTDTIEWIKQHPRLLRSLAWGDDDYGGHVYDAIGYILQQDYGNVEKLLKYECIEGWIKGNEPKLYLELYGENLIPTDVIMDISQASQEIDVEEHINRIRDSLVKDPAVAIGSTKELLETVFKTVLHIDGAIIGKDDMPKLWKKVQTALVLDPSQVESTAPGADSFRRLLGSMTQIVVSITELRNLYGTGHGKSKATKLDTESAQLVVAAGTVLARYIMRRHGQIKSGASRTW